MAAVEAAPLTATTLDHASETPHQGSAREGSPRRSRKQHLLDFADWSRDEVLARALLRYGIAVY